MQKRTVQRGRPAGSTTFDAELAQAFGAAVRALRTERGIAQETLANLAGVERSHMGKVERGEHQPTLSLIFKIAGALGCSTTVLMAEAEDRLGQPGTILTKTEDQRHCSTTTPLPSLRFPYMRTKASSLFYWGRACLAPQKFLQVGKSRWTWCDA